MREIQDLFEETIKDVPHKALEILLADKFKSAGIKVARKTIARSATHILSGKRGTLDIPGKGKHKTIEFTADDLEKLVKGVENFYETGMKEMIETTANSIAELMYNSLHQKLPKQVRDEKKFIAGFKSRLEERYDVGLNKLRMMVTMAREWAEDLKNRKIAEQGKFSILDDVLFRLHVRACQIVTEVVTLLESGLADGAMARWRTLHEVSTVATFIYFHGENAAIRYRDYQIVESKRGADLYKTNHEAFGYKALSKRDCAKIDSAFKRIIEKHEPLFAEEYGWAGTYLPGGRANFAKIEAAVGIPEMRSVYKLASYNVHASPKGAFYRIGALEGSGALIAGHSNAGLTEPAQNTVVSFTKLCMLLPGKSSAWIMDDIVIGKIFDRIMWEVPRDFWEAEKKLTNDATRELRDILLTQ
jgi:hypothetical protein